MPGTTRRIARHTGDPIKRSTLTPSKMCGGGNKRSAEPLHTPSLAKTSRRKESRGIRETQEMLDFCAEHGITADIELIRMQQINEAYDRLLKSDVKYRFVIDLKPLQG